jgi:hypothetical protein
MTLDASGNLGVGTTSPAAKLQSQVSRTSGSNVTALILSDNVTGTQTSGYGTQIQGLSNNGAAVSAIGFEAYGGTNNDTGISFYTQYAATALTRRVTIDSYGNLLVGTTTANNSKFAVGTPFDSTSGSQTASFVGSKAYFASFASLPQGQLAVYDNSGTGTGAGGAISFMGYQGSGGTWYGSIQAYKSNSSSTDYGAHMLFYTRPSGSVNTIPNLTLLNTLQTIVGGSGGFLSNSGMELQNGSMAVNSKGSYVPFASLQMISGLVAANSSGSYTTFCFISESHCANIRVMAVDNRGENYGTGSWIGVSTITYGGGNGPSVTQQGYLSGSITNIAVQYNNSGYVLQAAVTYSGASSGVTIYFSVDANAAQSIYAS